MSPSQKRASPFRPKVKGMDSDTMGIVRLLIVSVVLFMFIAPMTSSYEPTHVIIQNDNPANIAQEQPFSWYGLPDTNIPITVGEISGYRGFAYVIEEESRLYFVDMINHVTMDIALPEGVKANGGGMKGYVVDLDGDTEFFLRNYVNSQYYILMVDIDDGLVSEFPTPFIYPGVQGFGIFNGDAYPDLVIQNVNNRDNFMTLDVIANATIGTFLVDYCYGVVVGNFYSASEDSIGLFNTMGTSGQRNLTVVEADGTQVTNIIVASSILDMVTFKYGAGLDEIAAIHSNGFATVYTGSTLGVVYSQSVDPLTSGTSFIETGDFNLDSQDDFVVISREQEMAYFRDGNDGSSIREVDNGYTYSQKNVAVGYMDHYAIQDGTVGTTLGGLGTIRGSDGNYANLEYLIDVQISSAHQIISYDANQDNREDVFCRVLSDVYLILSDRTNPTIDLQPLDPVHPTIMDDFVTIEVYVNETSDIEYADIWMRAPGGSLWYQPQDEMYASHTEGI